jgi:hypothetical protein
MHTVSLINAIMLTAELNASDNIYKEQVLLSLLLSAQYQLLLDSESESAYTLPNNTAFRIGLPCTACEDKGRDINL